MTSPVFARLLTCLILGKKSYMSVQALSSVHQERRFISANVGDNVTLRCFCDNDDATRIYWYKQTLGQKPRPISTFSVFGLGIIFYNEFKNNSRFSLDAEEKKNLNIFDLNISDSATYYCASSNAIVLDFKDGTIINVEDSGLKVPATVHQSASESIQPGGSVTLNCTVHTGTSDGEHSVYWFKKSDESQPGLIYTHGGRTDQCERKPNTQTHTCVYKLPMKSLNHSHAGTYYCAVASCGHILFGDGTKLEIEDEVAWVDFLSKTLTFTTILSVLLAFLVCMMNNRNSCLCAESQARFSDSSKTKLNASKMQRDDTWSECVYFSVKP